MKRRVYLAGVAGVGFAGCVNRNTRISADSENVTSESPIAEDSSDEPEPSLDVEVFDDFSDLSHWRVRSGSMNGNEQRGSNGSKVASLEAGHDDSSVAISRTLSEPIDCTGKNPGLALAANDTAVPTIQLFDESGDRVDFRRPIKADRPMMRHNFGIEEVVGSPDLSAVTEIRITLWVGDDSKELWLDELHFVTRPEIATVMIQFDDGYETDYTEAFPILNRYGYPAVTFVNPGRIGNDEFLDLGQSERLQDAGWAVANHSHTHAHLESLEPDEQTAEIVNAKEWLVDHGFDRGARYFAYPFGEWDDHTLDVVQEHHDLAFWGGHGVHGHPVNPILCSREPGDPTAERAIEALDAAVQWGGHVRLFYHRLAGEQLSDFEATIDHLHELDSAGDIDIVLPSDVERTLAD